MPNARSTIRASPRMSCVRLKVAPWPLRRARMTLKPCDRRIGGLQRLEAPHWTDQLLQLAMTGLDDIVQILDLSMHHFLRTFAFDLQF